MDGEIFLYIRAGQVGENILTRGWQQINDKWNVQLACGERDHSE